MERQQLIKDLVNIILGGLALHVARIISTIVCSRVNSLD